MDVSVYKGSTSYPTKFLSFQSRLHRYRMSISQLKPFSLSLLLLSSCAKSIGYDMFHFLRCHEKKSID